MSERTLTAMDGDATIQFTDYVCEGDRVEVYRTFENAERESGSSRLMVVHRDGDEWRLTPVAGGPGDTT